MSVIWIVAMTFYEPHGRRKRPKLETRDNDGGVSVEHGLALAEVREIAARNGLEQKPRGHRVHDHLGVTHRLQVKVGGLQAKMPMMVASAPMKVKKEWASSHFLDFL